MLERNVYKVWKGNVKKMGEEGGGGQEDDMSVNVYIIIIKSYVSISLIDICIRKLNYYIVQLVLSIFIINFVCIKQ